MNILIRISGAVFLISSSVLFTAPVDYDLDVYIHMFKIPRIQNFMANLPVENGGIINARIEGDLTAVFPDGVVLLQTELAHNASNSAIFQAIQDRVSFGSGNIKATRISIEDLKAVHLQFDNSHSSEEVQFDHKISSQHRENYELWVGVKSVKEDEVIIEIRFESGWSSSGGRIGTSIICSIFKHTIALAEHKVLLIGFPSNDDGPRGTVYWLACSVIKNNMIQE